MQKRSKLLQHLADVDPNVLEVLRSHLFAEQILNELLCNHLGITNEQLEKVGLAFAKKLAIASAAKMLPAALAMTLKKLNALRNECAHSFQYSPTREEVFGLFEGMK